MSIIMKYMVGGKVNVNEFNSFEKLLPVMAHVQDEKYPYYVMQDGKAIFKYNLQYVEKQAKPAEVYTLRVKYPDKTGSEDYTDLVSLAAATMAANDAKFPWYVVDNAGNIIRKGNLDKLPSKNTTPAPKAGVAVTKEVEDASDVDIDAIVDEASNAIADIDDGPTEEELFAMRLDEFKNRDSARIIAKCVYEVSWFVKEDDKAIDFKGHFENKYFDDLDEARSFCSTLQNYKLTYIRITDKNEVESVFLIDKCSGGLHFGTKTIITAFVNKKLPISQLPELFSCQYLIKDWLKPFTKYAGIVTLGIETGLMENKTYDFIMNGDYADSCHIIVWPSVEACFNEAKDEYNVYFYNYKELKPWIDATWKFEQVSDNEVIANI